MQPLLLSVSIQRQMFVITCRIVSNDFCFPVPEDSSIALQRLIESLFITHANTRLNSMGHIDDSVEKSEKNLHGMKGEILIADRGDWCANLVRPS